MPPLWLVADMCATSGRLADPTAMWSSTVKNDKGIIVGIAQTATPDTLGEMWSSGFFYPGPNNVGYVNLGFVWENGQMRGLRRWAAFTASPLG